jgi:hypothetical protein
VLRFAWGGGKDTFAVREGFGVLAGELSSRCVWSSDLYTCGHEP